MSTQFAVLHIHSNLTGVILHQEHAVMDIEVL